MTQTVLILGATGRFGRNAAMAFWNAGWTVRAFDRKTQDLNESAQGADVIVNGWNPLYPDWARLVPKLNQQVIAAASDAGATVIIPGNVYVYGADTPGPWSASTLHRAQNPLGRIRVEMEAAYRDAPVRTIILRAGDFIDTRASGNWFDQIITNRLAQGQVTYPGRSDAPHAWAYLPDLARAAVALAEMRDRLPRFCQVPYAGYTLTGAELTHALSQVTGEALRLRQMRWWPLQLARPFWRLAPHLIEMRYLWDLPHRLDCTLFNELVGDFRQTEIQDALAAAIRTQVGVHQPSVDPARV